VRKLEGKITYDQDSKRYHRYQVEGEGMVGTVYLSRTEERAKRYRIILEPVEEE